MRIKPFFIVKLILILLIILYISFFDINCYINKINSIITLGLSILLLYRSRNNLLMFLIAFFIFYCNYSIVIGEYIVGGNLGVRVYEVKNIHIYGIAIRILLLFMSIITIFYKNQKIELSKFRLIPKDNIIIFYSLIFILIYILVFGIKRGNLYSYSVRIAPIYEYSIILFLFSYYFSGKSNIRRNILGLLIILFVLQDFYYGGRITSLQLILLLIVTVFIENLRLSKIISCGLIGIFINSMVGEYRRNYTLELDNLIEIIVRIFKDLFVFSTPVYAYYASATHIAAFEVAELHIRTNSLLEFIKAIFIGSKDIRGNVTKFVAENYFFNIGGGLLPTHFYFWMGWLGVIIIALIIVFIANNLGSGDSNYLKILSLGITITVPRWYLYSPLNLFRGPLVLTTILFIIFSIIHEISSKNSKNINIL